MSTTCFPVDDIGSYLFEANAILDSIVKIDPFSEIFEAGDEKVKEQVADNEEKTEKATGLLQKAAQALLNLFRRIKDSIGDFIAKRKLDKEQREAYEAFVQACKSDPSLKKKKIMVKDFKRICEEHDAILKEVEAKDREIAQGKNVDITELQNKITNFGKGIGGAATTALSIEAILNTCSVNQAWARQGYNLLRSNEKVYQTLCDNIGEKRAKKTEKELKALSKRISLRRLWLHATGRTYKDVYSAMSGALNSVKTCVVDGASLGKTVIDASAGDIATRSTEGAVKHAVRPVVGGAKAVGAVAFNKDNRRKAWNLAMNRRVAQNFAGGTYVRGGIKSVIGGWKGIDHAARQYGRSKVWSHRLNKWVYAPIDKVVGQVNEVVDNLSPSESDAFIALLPANLQTEYKYWKGEGRKAGRAADKLGKKIRS